jgi:hypothetical protein
MFIHVYMPLKHLNTMSDIKFHPLELEHVCSLPIIYFHNGGQAVSISGVKVIDKPIVIFLL